MTTFSEFRDLVENAVNDAGNTHFSTDVIEEWIADAIREYSQHFPRQKSTDITTTNPTRTYDLPADFQDALFVIYPLAGDDEPLLTYAERTGGHFFQDAGVDGYYTLLRHADAQDSIEIQISAIPDDAETIRVHYLGDHDSDSWSASTAVSVPERHHPILIKYCVWQALKYLEQAEEQDPTSNSSLLMAQMAQNAYRAERAYYSALRRAIAGQQGRSSTLTWKLDKHDRIY